MAGRYDIIIEQGATFILPMTIKNSDGTPFRLDRYRQEIGVSNWIARGQLRRNRRSTTVVASFSFTYTDRALGKMEASLADHVTQTIPAGETSTDPRSKYVYDIEIYNAGHDEVKRLLEGFAYISPEVTRQS